MRLIMFLLVATFGQLIAARGYSQTARLNFNFKGVTVEEVINRIEETSDFYFLYNKKIIDVERKVDINAENKKITEVLDQLFSGSSVAYTIVDRQIVLSETKTSQQQKTVTGKVTDPGKQPLPGVTVIVKGTTNGIITDFDGNFSLMDVPGDATLVFSFVGMKSQEVSVAGKTTINVMMQEETIGIDEVVAIGYGTVKKANLTGATASVNFSKLESRPASNAASLLQGQMSGVTVSNFNTQPGNDNPEIRIRGIGTFNAGQNPLVIVDGVESSLTQIPTADIESVSVLKDAASAAIYGVRAANGVILVTTKRGTARRPVVNFKQNNALQKVLVIPDMVDSWDYADIINMNLAAKGSVPLYTEAMIQKMKDGSDPDNFANTDWVEEMFRVAPMNTTYLSVDGGSENVRYLFSGEYFDQTGILLGTSTKRYSFRSNIDANISHKIKVGMDLSGHTRRINETLNSANESDGNSSIFYDMRRNTNPTVPLKFQNGQWGTINGLFNQTKQLYPNPVYKAQLGSFFTDKYFFQGKVYADIEPVKNLNYRINLAGVYNSSNMTRFSPSEIFYYPNGDILSQNTQNSLQNNNATDTKYILENILTYKYDINNHKLSFLAGQSAQFYRYDFFSASVKDLPNNLLHELSAGVNEKEVAGNANEVALQSFFGRVNYNYADKYLLEMNVRRDGSSRMPKESRYGVFPSFSGAWIISNEDFVGKSSALSFLKFRASWGQLGNQEIGNYAYVQNINLGQNYIIGDALTAGAALTSLANDKIKWETTTIIDLGLDVNLFKDKLQFVFDVFDKTSSDILVTLPIPQTLGNLSAPYQNIANVKNQGFEADIKYNGRINDLTYFAGANLSMVKNEIIDIAGLETWISNGGRNINREGHPINSYYGLIAEGFFQSEEEIASSPSQFAGLKVYPGDVKYRDISGPDGVPDGKVDETYDRDIIGSPFPKMTYSFNFGGSYKGFDLYCFFQGVSGIDRYFWYNNEAAGNFSKDVLDYWREDNRNAKYPRFGNETNNSKNSTLWLKDASYFRLKNLELGYTLPKMLTKKVSIDKARIYLSGTNLWTITDVVDFDPEKIVADERNRVYPQAKVFSIGLNVTF